MIVFDIETVPTAAALARPYPEADRLPPGNYKSAEAIAKWHETDRAKWAAERNKECSINPRLGRVVALACAWTGTDRVTVDVAKTEEEERHLLTVFWGHVNEAQQIGGFNSMAFDLPFLLVRSLACRVRVPVRVGDYLRRYSHHPHFDARMALTMWDARASGTLDDWCAFLGIKGKSGHGSEVAGMVERGEWAALTDYATADIHATKALIEAIAPTFSVSVARIR